MNLCFLNYIQALGGGEIWVLNACGKLAAQGHQVSVICASGSELHAACVRLGVGNHAFDLSENAPFFGPITAFLKYRSIDVLYCTVIGQFWEAHALQQIAEAINRERFTRPLVLVPKTGLPPMQRAPPGMYGVGLNPTVRRLHVVSAHSRNAFLDWLPGIGGFVETMREGVDLRRFDKAQFDVSAARERWLIPAGHRVITCLARLSGMKGQDLLLEAATAVLAAHSNTLFLLAGEGEDRERLVKLAEERKLTDSVRFLGHVKDTPSLLAATDVFCHPSRNDGMPNSVIESMAMSAPVVATPAGGIPEVVEHGTTGLLAAPENAADLASRLLELLDDSGLARMLAASARHRIEKDFDLEKNLRALVDRLRQEQAELDRDPASGGCPRLTQSRWPAPVLFLFNNLRTGGEETEVAIIARRLDRRRFLPQVLSLWDVPEPSPGRERLLRLGIPIDTTCHGIGSVEYKVRYIIEKIRRERVPVVWACQDTAVAYWVVSNFAPDECKLIEHGGIVGEATRIPKDRTARYVGVSKAITAAAAAHMPRPESALTIPSMVDTAEFAGLDRAAIRFECGLPEAARVVIFVGRLDAKKGVERIIDAAETLLPRDPNAVFLIVGPPDAFQPQHAAELYQRARTVTATGRFRFIGSRQDIPELLTASDILVLPSIGEGMSHVINEAGAAGLAVIAMDDGAAREQLDDGSAGILIPPGQPELFQRRLEELLLDRDLREGLGMRLREKVRITYSAEALMPRWHSLFESVVMELPSFAGACLRTLPPDTTV